MGMILSKQAKKAHREVVEAAVEKGANCMTSPYPERWTGWLDDEGRPHLPTDEAAKELCRDCPLLDAECREWASKGSNDGVVLNGKVYDLWKEAIRDEV